MNFYEATIDTLRNRLVESRKEVETLPKMPCQQRNYETLGLRCLMEEYDNYLDVEDSASKKRTRRGKKPTPGKPLRVDPFLPARPSELSIIGDWATGTKWGSALFPRLTPSEQDHAEQTKEYIFLLLNEKLIGTCLVPSFCFLGSVMLTEPPPVSRRLTATTCLKPEARLHSACGFAEAEEMKSKQS